MQAMGERKSLKGGGHRHGASVPVGRDASLTEIAAINRFPEIPVGRGDDSDAGLTVRVPPSRWNSRFLQHA